MALATRVIRAHPPSRALTTLGWVEIETGWWKHEPTGCTVCLERNGWASYVSQKDTEQTAPRFAMPHLACKDAVRRATNY
jgi:hypothetical protein